MNRLGIVMLAGAVSAVSLPATAQQPANMTLQDVGNGTAPSRARDRIGLTATQRQMIAWSLAGLGHLQPAPPSFRPAPGTKAPAQLRLTQVPTIVHGVAPPAQNYQYAILDNKDLLLVEPQDETVADVIHLRRRL